MQNCSVEAPARATEQVSSPVVGQEPPTVGQHTDVTDTVTRLLVRPVRSKYLNPDLVPSAQFAGFEWADRDKSYPGRLAVVDQDTGMAYAVISKPNGVMAAMGQVEDLTIIIDPMAGPVEWGAGDRIASACVKFATAMRGALYHANGEPVTEADAKALADKINAVMDARREQERPRRERQPDGTYREPGELSYHSTRYTARGRHLGSCHFEAEPAEWFVGKARGYEMALEMLAFMKAHKSRNHALLFSTTLADAFRQHDQARRSLVSYDEPSTGNVASGFVDCMAEMVIFAARHCEFERWIERRINAINADSERMAAHESKEKAAFVERMRTARAAKKAGAA